jgi:hypothetical protein
VSAGGGGGAAGVGEGAQVAEAEARLEELEQELAEVKERWVSLMGWGLYLARERDGWDARNGVDHGVPIEHLLPSSTLALKQALKDARMSVV